MAQVKVSAMSELLVDELAIDDEIMVADTSAGASKRCQVQNFSIDTTFTPTLGDGTNDFTLTTADGYCTRVGNQVTVSGLLVWSSIGSAGAGQLIIEGLPYAATSSASYRSCATFGECYGIESNGDKQITGRNSSTGTVIRFYQLNDNATASIVAANGCSATGQIEFSMTYQAE